MHRDAQILTMMQWLSPAYPLGSFAYSHGIEAAIAAGWIGDCDTLTAWLRDLVDAGTGRSDTIWLRLAYRADAEALVSLDAQARAFSASAERREETHRQGVAFARTTRRVWSLALPDLLLPLALGRAGRLLSMDEDLLAAAALQAFVGNLVAAAQRLMPLGQSDAQEVVAGLRPDCLRVAGQTAGAVLGDVYGNAFLSDIAAMRHETQSERLFQS